MCLRVLSSRSDLMKDVFGELSRTALVNMLAANDSKDGVEGRSEVSRETSLICIVNVLYGIICNMFGATWCMFY